MNPQQANAQRDQKAPPRRGVVIVAVLLVVILLSLAAYQYADMTTAEAAVSANAHRAVQTRAFAESGIYYTAALLSNQQNVNNVLNGNPYNNSQVFQGIPVPGDNGLLGRFSIIGPMESTTGSVTGPTYGVSDETGKINLVSWMNIDPTGAQLLNVLGALPNMTPQIAASIVAWMGGSAGISAGGAQDDYYQGLTPPYRCKNNVPDSLDELLLVQGVTRDLLYGADTNRNAVQDPNEQASTSSTTPPMSGFDRGWSAFLTIHSREQNSDCNGNPYMSINNNDLQQLYNAINVEGVDTDLAKFIILYQQYGPANSTGGSQGLLSSLKAVLGGSSSGSTGGSSSGGMGITIQVGGASQSTNSNTVVQGTLANYTMQYNMGVKTPNAIKSFFQLVNAKVNVPGKDANGKAITTQYTSPFYNNTAYQRQYMPALFNVCTIFQNPEIPCRININTAPQEILYGLENIGSTAASSTTTSGSSSGSTGTTGLADTDVLNIIQMRQNATGQPGDIYATPTWLLTEANISPTVLQALDQYVTTRSQVYRVQSVGYYDGGKGPAARIEAVIDTGLPSGGTAEQSQIPRPRIIAWRNLSDLGKGWTDPNSPNANQKPNQ